MSSLRAYYNDSDQFVCAWVRELIKAGEITDGVVDERSIEDVVPSDLVGFDRVHFFCGIAGWDLALNLAGWGDRPIWTGSAPCQPFSAAGQGAGFADERHLWPAFHWLISQCRPRYVCGEQVASGDALRWWDLVATDLEGAGYACTAVDLPAASVGAPHKRSRLFWLADAVSAGRAEGWPITGRRSVAISGVSRLMADAEHPRHYRSQGAASESECDEQGQRLPDGNCRESAVADAEHAIGRAQYVHGADGCDGPHAGREEAHGQPGACSAVQPVADTSHDGRRGRGWPERDRPEGRQQDPCGHQPDGCGDGGGGMDNAIGSRLEGFGGHGADGDESRWQRTDTARPVATASGADAWADLEWLPCTDGKARPTQPGLQPLAYGVPNRVGTLCGAGNAIVPQTAAEVLRAWQAVMS